VPVDSFAEPAIRQQWIREKNLRVFSLWTAGGILEVDLFVEEPFDFDEVYARAVRKATTGRTKSTAAGRPAAGSR